MEKIARYIFDDEFPARDVWLCTATSLSNVSEAIGPRVRTPFVLFVAADATGANDDEVRAQATKLVELGMVYACLWGPACNRVEDLVDAAAVAVNPHETDADVIMTTAHPDETLEDAVWYFMNCAWPASRYERICSDWIAVSVASPQWERELRDLVLTNGPAE